ncbi:unnamed protein product, partial [Mesorhabditis belari]|uniref:Uncharacterized protein n=1 Tax=Mesorhabditis belari TaxID=2138241 RepID=A0AAF3J6R5_9BILA
MGSVHSASSVNQIKDIVERLERQRIDREIALRDLTQRRQRAYELAVEQEKLPWIATAGIGVSGFLIANAYLTKNYNYLSPLPAIMAYIGYNTHLCYGNKLQMIYNSGMDIWKSRVDDLTLFAISPDDVKARSAELALYRKENDDLFAN